MISSRNSNAPRFGAPCSVARSSFLCVMIRGDACGFLSSFQKRGARCVTIDFLKTMISLLSRFFCSRAGMFLGAKNFQKSLGDLCVNDV